MLLGKTLLFISDARPGIDVVCKIRMPDFKEKIIINNVDKRC